MLRKPQPLDWEAFMTPLEQLPIPLLVWYHENKRTLPWRSDPTPYHVLVSEIMLQQTRVAAVLGYYARFLEALPTVEDLAAVEEERLLKLWQGLGYYNRARNLRRAARQVVEDFGGVFPSTFDRLLTLAGVGEYTAGAIASIAFGQAVPAVDGNVLRVTARITGDRADVGRPETKRAMAAALQGVMPLDAPGDFNQALMELGATVCLPNGAPLCGRCPAREFCTAHLKDWTGEVPVKSAKKARRVEERSVWLLFHDGRVALRRRPERGLLAGLWEYPNTLNGEDCPVDCTPEYVGAGKHIFTHIEWHWRAYAAQLPDGVLPDGWVWAAREELAGRYALPNAFQGVADYVEQRLEGDAEWKNC